MCVSEYKANFFYALFLSISKYLWSYVRCRVRTYDWQICIGDFCSIEHRGNISKLERPGQLKGISHTKSNYSIL